MSRRPDLSVIIVNHNTVEDLRKCLGSIDAAEHECDHRIWVVDNASTDGSAEMVRAEFPDANLLANEANEGFARANNRAIEASRGEYVLLLNPDTIVSDRAFDRILDFLRRTPDAGMATAKLVKADGTLDLACRRSFPTPFDGLCRSLGLSDLFPDSRIFARYNLRYLDENEIAEVEAINGAFMMVRRAAIEDVGLLDEGYFMYMEDLDWCYRFGQAGWRIYYVPEATVVHLKGRSSRKKAGEMIHAFFTSMEQFCKKIYRPRYNPVTFTATIAGIRVWKWVTLIRNQMRRDDRRRVRP